jgi:Flp pilus assembly protein TadG
MNHFLFRNLRSVPHAGTTSVEFACVLPVFLTLLIGGLQLFRFAMVANTVESAVVEAARKGILRGSTTTQVESVAKQVMDQAGLTNFKIAVSRTTNARGSVLHINAQLPLAGNGFLAPSTGSTWTVKRACSVRCE